MRRLDLAGIHDGAIRTYDIFQGMVCGVDPVHGKGETGDGDGEGVECERRRAASAEVGLHLRNDDREALRTPTEPDASQDLRDRRDPEGHRLLHERHQQRRRRLTRLLL